MGYIRHRLLIAEVSHTEREKELTALKAWRSDLPAEWAKLVIGPVPAIVNGNEWVIFLPDGSKEGWSLSKRGYDYAKQFCGIFSSHSWSQVHEMTWGDDRPSARASLSEGEDEDDEGMDVRAARERGEIV